MRAGDLEELAALSRWQSMPGPVEDDGGGDWDRDRSWHGHIVAHGASSSPVPLDVATCRHFGVHFDLAPRTDVAETMAAETETTFARAIQDHLALKERNADIDVPLDRYAVEDPFENHPLFKSEEQARLEETMETAPAAPDSPAASTALPWPGEDEAEGPALADDLWGRSRDFDWGD